jgi:hypothetical protein
MWTKPIRPWSPVDDVRVARAESELGDGPDGFAGGTGHGAVRVGLRPGNLSLFKRGYSGAGLRFGMALRESLDFSSVLSDDQATPKGSNT